MSGLLDVLYIHGAMAPERVALSDGERQLAYGEVSNLVARGALLLADSGVTTLGLLADNGIAWVLADLAALQAVVPCVPLPLFFSAEQLLHAVRDAGVDGMLTDRPQSVLALLARHGMHAEVIGEFHGLQLLRIPKASRPVLPLGTAKITYTSGTTGAPKGVCLSRAQMETVADALRVASGANITHHHICLTPLATLLENIGGVYASLLAGACCCVPSLARVGLCGATGLNPVTMLDALHAFDASTAIFAPQMLLGLVTTLEGGASMPPNLHFIAVGGAPVSPQLLARAAARGLPIYEGYGLSECTSVVALNTATEQQPGSVGKPLPHATISFAADGEILVDGAICLGYLGGAPLARPWPTGDIGFIDAHGYLHITGRKKNMFITALGRNVAPEWVERELTLHPAIAQAAVFGEGKPWNCAVIVSRATASHDQIAHAVDEVNQHLPDYARITRWLPATAPFAPDNEQLTANGRLRRAAIREAYAHPIESLYEVHPHDVLC